MTPPEQTDTAPGTASGQETANGASGATGATPAVEVGPALHDILLSLAGRLPDDLIATARTWLSQNRMEDVARAVAFAVLSYRVPLRENDVIVLAEIILQSGTQPIGLGQAEVATDVIAPPFLFSRKPAPGADDAPARTKAAIGAIDQQVDVGLWRVWRRTSDGSPWPAPRPVWLLEVVPGTDPVAAGRRVQQALETAGEPNPQVEAYVTGAELPIYQCLARDASTLVWSRDPDRQIRLAPVFDEVDDTGTPSFRPDHPRIADPGEKLRLVSYLDHGELLLVSPTLADDILDPERGPVVPMNFRTDGTWVWTDALTYYLDAHGLGPDPDFLAHLRAGTGAWPAVDGVGLHRALAFLSG